MGDKRRGKFLTEYIARNFRGVRSIISVADGNFMLAKELYRQYDVIIYDPNIRNNNRVVRQSTKVIGKNFSGACQEKCDLIIGLHPDEATGEIVDYALRTKTPCLIVPCCKVGKYADECPTKTRWSEFLANKLRHGGFDTYIDCLPISGNNLAIRALPLYYKPPR